MNELNEKELKATKLLYDHLGLDLESYPTDMENGYLTQNLGRDGLWYMWYLDNSKECVISVDNLEIIADKEFIERNFC